MGRKGYRWSVNALERALGSACSGQDMQVVDGVSAAFKSHLRLVVIPVCDVRDLGRDGEVAHGPQLEQLRLRQVHARARALPVHARPDRVLDLGDSVAVRQPRRARLLRRLRAQGTGVRVARLPAGRTCPGAPLGTLRRLFLQRILE